MRKRLIVGLVLTAVLAGSSGLFAAQNVANTSQKGSLLVFPLIDVRPENTATTQIEISNDQNLPVHVECYYVNERKGRRDFDFFLSPKQTVSWDVLSENGDIAPAAFPNDGGFPGDPNAGELICFAVDTPGSTQVRFNHLTGTATVVYFNVRESDQSVQSFKYNAWAFTARSNDPTPPPDLSPVGKAGQLLLTGGGDGTYDACPEYLIANFSPGGASNPGLLPARAISLNSVSYLDNALSVSICTQDLRQDFIPHFTKLQINIWNVDENSFSGTYQCTDSTFTWDLEPTERGILEAADPAMFKYYNGTGFENFTFATLRTDNARFQVQGIPSTQCLPLRTEADGLVGVLASSYNASGPEGPDYDMVKLEPDGVVGSTLQGAGSESGIVLWDPQQSTVPEATKPK
jgi:hypothetical protein